MRYLPALLLLLSCQTSPKTSPSLSEPSPENKALASYTQVFGQLPLAASLTKLPWPSDSWTTVHGGAGFRWQLAADEELEDLEDLAPFVQYPIGAPLDLAKLSPIEKLDILLGNSNWDLTKKERERTLGQKNSSGQLRSEIPEWEGIMHAWSIAALQFDPVGSVTMKAKDGRLLTFEKQDIYSLLSLYVHEQAPRISLLASICHEAELGAGAGAYAFENEKQSLRARGCKKMDPATFHTVLTNQIGKLNEGFVMDRDYEGVISNNPVVAYESRLVEEPGANSKGPRTVRLRTVVFLTSELAVNTSDQEDEAYPYDIESYEYTLNLDAKGKIISGQWLASEDGEFNISIPDFLWKSSPIWLNGPLKNVYEQARESFADQRATKQLRPIEDMPDSERQALNSYLNGRFRL